MSMQEDVAHPRIEDFLDMLIERLMRAPMKRSTKAGDKIIAPIVDVAISIDEIFRLCRLAAHSFLSQDSLLKISTDHLPITIFGDIHGQFRELRLMLHSLGAPDKNRKYLFLGDYVDRGPQSVECMVLLLALKVRHPASVFLLRGNHEDLNCSMVFGFYDECASKYAADKDQLVVQSFVHVFNCMPLACLLGGKVLTMHGGISPNLKSLNDINKIKRPTFVPLYGLCTDLVWADPGASRGGWSQSRRGISYQYDDTIISRFCNEHGLDLIIRGHQISDDMIQTGYKATANGRMVTIFSAFNYMNMRNTGAVLTIFPGLKLKLSSFRPIKMDRRLKQTTSR